MEQLNLLRKCLYFGVLLTLFSLFSLIKISLILTSSSEKIAYFEFYLRSHLFREASPVTKVEKNLWNRTRFVGITYVINPPLLFMTIIHVNGPSALTDRECLTSILSPNTQTQASHGGWLGEWAFWTRKKNVIYLKWWSNMYLMLKWFKDIPTQECNGRPGTALPV